MPKSPISIASRISAKPAALNLAKSNASDKYSDSFAISKIASAPILPVFL
jgi:hypothetical protein